VLVAEDLERQLRVEQRIVQASALQLPILVMLDQMVVGIAREGQRVEPQRVDHRQLQQPQVGLGGGQMWQVESDQIMAEQEADAFGERVELLQRGQQIALPETQRGLRLVTTNGGKAVNPPIAQPDFQVNGKAAGSETTHGQRESAFTLQHPMTV